MREVGDKRQRLSVLPLAPEVGCAFERDAGRLRQFGRQGGKSFAGVPGLGPQRQPGQGGGLQFRRQQRDHFARCRATGAVEQHVGAVVVILLRQCVPEPGQHGPLRFDVETAIAPPAPYLLIGLL